MPLQETEAIVLRTYRLGEADKIVSLFARQMGRLRGVARGARRPKSRYGATLEPLSYIRLWIFERENRDLLRLNSAELVESFFAMQQDYRVQVAAQYVAEVTERFLPEREVNERVFRLLLAVLRALRASGQVTRPLLYFNYWMLRLGGFLPDLDRCAACGRGLGEEPGYYGPGSEVLLCRLCRTAATPRTLSPRGLRFAATARQSTLPHWMEAKELPPGCREAQRFLEEVIQAHVEKPLATRSLLEVGDSER